MKVEYNLSGNAEQHSAEEIMALLGRIEYLHNVWESSQRLLVASKQEQLELEKESMDKLVSVKDALVGEKESRLLAENLYEKKIVFRNYLIFVLSALLLIITVILFIS